MDTIRFALPPPQLSCLIGNLFTALQPPCRAGQFDADGITLCGQKISGEAGELHIYRDHCTLRGQTISGETGELNIYRDHCVFTGRLEDYQAARAGRCPGVNCIGR